MYTRPIYMGIFDHLVDMLLWITIVIHALTGEPIPEFFGYFGLVIIAIAAMNLVKKVGWYFAQ